MQSSDFHPMKAKGYIIHEDSERVIIATGFNRKSVNRKTGAMVQVWILVKRQSPIDAVKSGADSLICGSCPLRDPAGRVCYVNIGQAPLAVWRAYHAGRYERLNGRYHLFDGRTVRFGAYGDPAYIPFPILSRVAESARAWTGYSHQWRNPLFSAYRRFLMASAETLEGAQLAQSLGWRTFRVKPVGSPLAAGEIVCLSDSKGITCEQCRLCAGTSKPARSIAIDAHGTGKVHFSKN